MRIESKKINSRLSPRINKDSGKYGSKLQTLSHQYRVQKERKDQLESLGCSTLRSRRNTLGAASKTHRCSTTLGKCSIKNLKQGSVNEESSFDDRQPWLSGR